MVKVMKFPFRRRILARNFFAGRREPLRFYFVFTSHASSRVLAFSICGARNVPRCLHRMLRIVVHAELRRRRI
jgi:hypothetical protein